MLNKKIILIGGLLPHVSFNSLLNSSITVERAPLFAKLEDLIPSRRSELWIGQLSKEEVQAIDQAFPNFGFALSIAQTEKNSAEQIFDDDSLKAFYPKLSNCQNMKKGTFQGRTYILKPKKSMGRSRMLRGMSCLNAEYEAEAGVRIRQAVANIFLHNKRDLDAILAEFAHLKYLMAPIDCIDHIASLEVLDAISLHDVFFANRKPFRSTITPVPSDIPVPDLPSEDGVLVPRKDLFPDMDFGEAEERICMVQDMIKVVGFLHLCKIAHNDLQSCNFLIQKNNYTQLVLIDFDHAAFGETPFLIDCDQLIGTMGGYLFGTMGRILPKQINDSYIADPKTLPYTSEELEQIREILSDIEDPKALPYTHEEAERIREMLSDLSNDYS
ncbi:MAG: hypothetical protein LBJ13_01180 [Puniceicoccales bacterium]|jgi:hypothetical protein|nr:hypothetical protein [Puniceicoccales bacterium]